MAYILIDDGMFEHPKIEALRPPDVVAHMKAMCWSARRSTDGHIPPQTLRTLGITTNQAARLEGAGVWDRNGHGWVIHDWHDFNPPTEPEARKRWMATRRKRRERDGGVTDA